MAACGSLTSMEVRVTSSESGHTCAWTGDEIVVDDVGVTLTITITSNVTTSTTPVVDNL